MDKCVKLTKAIASIEDIVKIANGKQVLVSADALECVEKAHQVLLNATMAGHDIYGLTVGVGLNKDRKMVNAKGEISPEVFQASVRYNIGLLRSHAVAVGPDSDTKLVRAAMAIRLNTILTGGPGVSPAVADMFIHFINHDICPVIPSKGSVGVGDVVLMSHVGLAMIGDGKVYYKGVKMTAYEALKLTKKEPLKPFAKDGLAILSNNSYAAAKAVLLLFEAKQLCSIGHLVFATSLEAVNGNITPILPDVVGQRAFPGLKETSRELLDILKGSYLWDEDTSRPFQDALSFRNGPHLLAAMRSNLDRLEGLLSLQINSSDDNPTVIVGSQPTSELQIAKKFYTDGGAVLPTGNFCPVFWVVALEELSILIAHMASASAQRVTKLVDPYFTGLPRYLSHDETQHSLVALEIPMLAVSAEIRSLAMPSSFDYLPLARGLEDIGTNSVMVATNVQNQIDNSFIVLAIELFHAAQAIDLRQQKSANLKIGKKTKSLLKMFRKIVPFFDSDRFMSDDISKTSHFLKGLCLSV